MSYLYGLSIQGIQSYIFATTKMTEIVGASNLVARLPVAALTDCFRNSTSTFNDQKIEGNAAGSLKYLFEKEEDLKAAFLAIPKYFHENAGHITVSQAVVRMKEGEEVKNCIGELEAKLRAQRNVPKQASEMLCMGMRKNPKTGLPIFSRQKDDLDRNQYLKREEYKNVDTKPLSNILGVSDKELTIDTEKMSSDKYDNFIAVIHADGNGLGRMIKDNKYKGDFKDFSKKLQEATEAAVRQAFEEEILPAKDKEEGLTPFRPVIIGGDDITVITRGDLALPFTRRLMDLFEEKTKEIGENGLTICAGIAYVKSHYPFHYAAELAETLCKQAKEVSKNIDNDSPPSSLLFHRVQSSYVRDWEDIESNELRAGKVGLAGGPYFLKASKNTIKDLMTQVSLLEESRSPKSGIRQWLSALDAGGTRAEELMERLITMTPSKEYITGLKLKELLKLSKEQKSASKETVGTTTIYDALVIEDLHKKNKKLSDEKDKKDNL